MLLFKISVSPKSVIWKKNKKKLVQGPTLPSGFTENSKGQFCTVGLNKTHLMLIGYTLDHNSDHGGNVSVIDFPNQIWHQYTSITIKDTHPEMSA